MVLSQSGSRRAVLIVAFAYLAYFVIEVTVALVIGSASLVADSTDFLEDASFNVLVFVAMGWSIKNRARVGMILSAFLFAPTLAFVWEATNKIMDPTPPEPFALSLAGLGALAVTVTGALILSAYRRSGGSLMQAAFLSARNHALANFAIIGAGLVTAYVWKSAWPDLIVGLGIAIMNLDAAKEVWLAARLENSTVV